jgi:hypothetical protein
VDESMEGLKFDSIIGWWWKAGGRPSERK